MPSIGGLSNLQRQVRADEFRNRVMKAVAAGLVLILCAGSYFLYTRSGKRQRVMSLAVGGDQRFAVWQNSEDARQQRVQLRLQLEKGKVYHLSNDVTHRFTHHLAKAPATTDGAESGTGKGRVHRGTGNGADRGTGCRTETCPDQHPVPLTFGVGAACQHNGETCGCKDGFHPEPLGEKHVSAKGGDLWLTVSYQGGFIQGRS